MSHHVIVLGGGVAGMSAAHELAERNFQVTVLDKGRIAGGKARSFGFAGTGLGTRHDLPAEHGFRFFPGFYQHLPDTMKRIPYRNSPDGVFGNLVPATEMQILFRGRQHVVLPARFPRSLQEIQSVLHAANFLTTMTGLSVDDIAFYTERVWQLLTSSEERRAAELEGLGWWDYIEADDRSQIYQDYLGNTPRVLVAAKPRIANTKTVGDVLLQLLFNLVDPGVSADRVLNGPTNGVWIDPWLAYLRRRGVRYVHGAEVREIRCAKDDNRIVAVTVRHNGQDREVTGDFYVAALPVEKMSELLVRTPRLLDLDPTLDGIHALARDVDWMNGIQYYLTREPTLAYGHQMYLGSPWALTAISQAQFWHPDGHFPDHYGDGTVRTVLSVDVSDWDTRTPRGNRRAKDCKTTDEVAAEVWEQLKESLPGVLEDRFLHPKDRWKVDPAIRFNGGVMVNDEPLLVNTKDSWRQRPWARTRIPNLLLASDYVRTYTNLATMEAANEAARRAVNAILDETGSKETPCEVWELHEPFWLKPWRWWDREQYRAGRPWQAELPGFVDAMARSLLESAPAIGTPEGYTDATARETMERGVPLVPAYVQNEVANMIEAMQVALEEGDEPQMRSFFLPGVLTALDNPNPGVPGPPSRTMQWARDIAQRMARGQRMALDIHSLQEIRPVGPDLLVRFTFDLTTIGDRPERIGSRGQLEMTLVSGEMLPPDPSGQVGSGWRIRQGTYSPV